MSNTQDHILLVFAFVFFCIGTFLGPYPADRPWYWRCNIVSLGLACWVATLIFKH